MKKWLNRYLPYYILTVLAPLAYCTLLVAKQSPDFTDRFFSQTLYPALMAGIGFFTAPFPFAVAELGMVLLPLLFLLGLGYCLYQGFRKKQAAIPTCLRFFGIVLSGLSLFYFVFILTCGVNYHRLPFAAHSGLTLRPSSTQELAALCQELTEQTNAARQLVQEDEGGVFRLQEQNIATLSRQAEREFAALGEIYPVLAGDYGRVKAIAFSEVMSQANYLGFYASYTAESCINQLAPDYNLPTTMCHELAHMRAFMREDEANFISYLACIRSSDADFRYSGLAKALIYSMNALYQTDRELFFTIREQYSPGLVRDLEDDASYWRQYQGKVSKAATAWNDTYLKANSQADGVQSYGRMVDLLLADYRMRHGISQ